MKSTVQNVAYTVQYSIASHIKPDYDKTRHKPSISYVTYIYSNKIPPSTEL